MAFGDIIQSAEGSAYPATSVTVNINAAVGGNLLVCAHFTGDDNSTAPSGYAEAVAVTDGGNADQGAIYWKVAAGGETSVVPGSDGSDEHMAIAVEIEGPWEGSPVDKTATDGPDTRADTPTGTTAETSQADEVAVAGITLRDSSPNFGSWTDSFVDQKAGVNSPNKSLAAATKLLSSTGTVDTSITHDSGVSMGMIATFKKAAVGGISVPIAWHHLSKNIGSR